MSGSEPLRACPGVELFQFGTLDKTALIFVLSVLGFNSKCRSVGCFGIVAMLPGHLLAALQQALSELVSIRDA